MCHPVIHCCWSDVQRTLPDVNGWKEMSLLQYWTLLSGQFNLFIHLSNKATFHLAILYVIPSAPTLSHIVHIKRKLCCLLSANFCPCNLYIKYLYGTHYSINFPSKCSANFKWIYQNEMQKWCRKRDGNMSFIFVLHSIWGTLPSSYQSTQICCFHLLEWHLSHVLHVHHVCFHRIFSFCSSAKCKNIFATVVDCFVFCCWYFFPLFVMHKKKTMRMERQLKFLYMRCIITCTMLFPFDF